MNKLVAAAALLKVMPYKKKQLGRITVENSGNIGKSYRRHDEIGTPLSA